MVDIYMNIIYFRRNQHNPQLLRMNKFMTHNMQNKVSKMVSNQLKTKMHTPFR